MFVLVSLTLPIALLAFNFQLVDIRFSRRATVERELANRLRTSVTGADYELNECQYSTYAVYVLLLVQLGLPVV